MGMILRANIDASNYAKKAASNVSNGLKLMGFFDTSIDKATRDFSTQSDANLSESGNVTVANDHCGLHVYDGYIQTDVAAPDNLTLFTVMRFPNAGATTTSPSQRGALFSNWEGTSMTEGGMHFGYQLNDTINVGMVLDGNMLSIFGNFADHTLWRLVVVTYDNTSKTLRLRSPTDGLDLNNTGTGEPTDSGKPFRIGSHYAGISQEGPSEVSQLRFYDRVLTEDEITEVIGEMRRYESVHNNRTV
ncbi:Concanavalin A-like lectin/glucanases superfamily protein [Halomonas caseinilytica]|uniref:Concanavalin A-like lectin/glucanases superfamily protein n=1 Tax=Halomonas caseinilytica TaxID=438744 RepID=A0A1M6TB04_9GAMM|nr:LamG-like jellyroll fold domain-containing protein [Halomonas caseinilytica]SHK54183.1 Concanavalin A-like lectin/glucanases superfamily protein [Halomonas caseinilytica]